MSREIRRVPMGWQHPMEWREQWDRGHQCVRQMLVPRPLFADYPEAVAQWERDGRDLENRTSFEWRFGVEYYLTGYQGRDDTEPTVHPYHIGDDEAHHPVTVRDEAHLLELLRADRAPEPDPDDYMPVFEGDPESFGYCMYETTSEGTPISPVMESPEALARWLADSGASAFGGSTATYEQWLATCRAGWAPSMVGSPAGLESGVAFIARTDS